MTTRINNKDLEAVVKRINAATNSPTEPWTRTDGKSHANVGNYHLDYAYGGVKLYRMSNEHGGVTEVLYTGYTTKRDLYNQMQAFLRGLES